MIRGILVEPHKAPRIIEFKEGYKELQRLVEGRFEMPALFNDVDIVINEDGKFNGSELNKLLYYNGKLVDMIFGNILIVDANDEGETISLSPEKIEKYLRIFNGDSLWLGW